MADLIITEKANITAIADKVRALDNSSASLNFKEMKDKLTFERQNVDGALAALAEKGVEVPEGSTAAALPELIGNIQIGSPTVEKKDVSFYDYDGTLLYSYTVEEANTLTALPAGPTHEGLLFDGWNWSLEDINKLTRPMDIGAMYHTLDGDTHIYIHLEEGHQDITFSICVNGNIVLDWGDGYLEQSDLIGTDLTVPIQVPVHHYAAPGDYVISFAVNGEAQLNENFSSVNSKWLRESTTKIEIGENVTIGTSAFERYGSLLNITIPSSITSLGESAFGRCRSLLSINIPSGVTRLEDGIFDSCVSLSTVTVPKSIEYFGENAFACCHSLQSIALPDLLTFIGAWGFYECSSLSNIIIPARANTIEMNAFQSCFLLSNVVIPEDLMYIRDGAFNNCESLSNITIPNNNHITDIGKNAFYYCTSLSSINIPKGVTFIEENAFEFCEMLLDITIPNGVKYINASAFNGCYTLSTITFPNGLESIGNQAFFNCNEVICFDFTQLSSIPTLSSQNALGAVRTLRPDCEIRVPASLAEQWKAATNWTVYADYIVGV